MPVILAATHKDARFIHFKGFDIKTGKIKQRVIQIIGDMPDIRESVRMAAEVRFGACFKHAVEFI